MLKLTLRLGRYSVVVYVSSVRCFALLCSSVLGVHFKIGHFPTLLLPLEDPRKKQEKTWWIQASPILLPHSLNDCSGQGPELHRPEDFYLYL
jgi:hypothetical protein